MYRRNRGLNLNPLWVIIAVNVVIFVTTLLDSHGMIYTRFALYPGNVQEQPWTLLTYMFLHSRNFTHILFNMISLYFLGTFVIQLVGETAFLLTYFIGGIFGGIVFVLFSFILPDAWVVGASGAVYALGGLLLVMRPNVKVVAFPIPIPMPLWVAILIGFLLVAFLPGVAWEAHLGGILYGAAIGYYYRQRENRSRYR
ncbi:MAG: rhomboid family intramembrane serine protease [Dehalococcoidales bacterium]|nr:rhomboid family intramembrane serine protease [Dehalococcoidales bacterium]